MYHLGVFLQRKARCSNVNSLMNFKNSDESDLNLHSSGCEVMKPPFVFLFTCTLSQNKTEFLVMSQMLVENLYSHIVHNYVLIILKNRPSVYRLVHRSFHMIWYKLINSYFMN